MTPPFLGAELNCPHVEQSVKFGYENLRMPPLISLVYIAQGVDLFELFFVSVGGCENFP